MGDMATVACQPCIEEGNEQRASRNFCTVQLENKGKLKWHVISAVGDQDISFDIRQIDTTKTYPVRFEGVSHGMITEYMPLRNLYVANPRHATGHFIVRVEACE
ncbi:MAG: hypothetical protein ACRCWY_00125 [Cellulosilyticaceae bacterium]